MRFNRLLISVGLLALLPSSLWAETIESPIVQQLSNAIDKFEQSKRNNWSFTITRFEDEEGEVRSSVERHDADKKVGERWSLITINGTEPTSKQQKKFIEEKNKKRQNKDKEKSFSIKLRELVNLSSAVLLEETETHNQVQFDVYIEKLGDDAIGKLKGQLSYNKQHEFIESITITNIAEFSPIFTASITELNIDFSFVLMDGVILPKQHNMKMKGSFAYFTEIDEISSDTYSEYQRVAEK